MTITSSPSADVIAELAPTGQLRAAINLGNSILAQMDENTGKPKGVSVELAAELARRLGVPLDMPTFDAAGKVFDALKLGAWDVAFLAVEPARAAEIEFTAPYVLIEGVYMVAADSPLKTIEEVDHSANRISVARGSAYDLYLSRTLKSATLVRWPTGSVAMKQFAADKLEVCAGVRQPIAQFVAENDGFRIIEPRFRAIQQAMGTPKGRVASVAYLNLFIAEMKSSGFVADALQRSGQFDAVVAP